MKTILKLFVVALAVVGYSQAFAAPLDITSCNVADPAPSTGWSSVGQWDSNGNGSLQKSDNDCWKTNSTANFGETDIETVTGVSSLNLIGKLEADGNDATGDTFTNSDVTITITGEDGAKAQSLTITSDADCSGADSCFLVVKDGNVADPSQYLLDLSGLDLSSGITIGNIFAGGGAISNVAFWAGEGTGVPEPMTLLLLGAGLLGFGVRRQLKA